MEAPSSNQGFTLIELAIVLAVLALVAVLSAGRYGNFRQKSRITIAQKEMCGIRNAFRDYLDDMSPLPGFSPAYLRIANILASTNLYTLGGRRADIDVGDWDGVHRAPPADFCTWDDASTRGWRGPYLLSGGATAPASVFPAPADHSPAGAPTWAERGFFPETSRLSLPADYRTGCVYGFPGEPALLDPWGAPYVLQIPPPQAFVLSGCGLAPVGETERFRYARIVSAGPDGILSTPCFYVNTNATGSVWGPAQRRASIFAGRPEDRGDDLVLFLHRPDAYRAAYNHEGDER